MLIQDSNVDSVSSRKSSRLTKPPIWMKDYMTTAIGQNSFIQSSYDYSLFTLKKPEGIVIVLIYVDDLLITGDNESLIREAKEVLHQKFKLKDL
uniref:Reverse transcriptase Ty1/copia-type domain-containing protein n=1 Tax=Solanum lycopersicum TaxID=4081 RepID=A0A3Q7I1Y8_SOLLC